MTDTIDHEVWVTADPAVVFTALTTREGLDSWWGHCVSADERVDGIVEFDHGLGAPLRMRVAELVPHERVVWECLADFDDPTNPASEWGGQQISFALDPRREVPLLGRPQDVTVLRFRSQGWPADSRWRGFCSTAWAMALGALTEQCEGPAE